MCVEVIEFIGFRVWEGWEWWFFFMFGLVVGGFILLLMRLVGFVGDGSGCWFFEVVLEWSCCVYLEDFYY